MNPIQIICNVNICEVICQTGLRDSQLLRNMVALTHKARLQKEENNPVHVENVEYLLSL